MNPQQNEGVELKNGTPKVALRRWLVGIVLVLVLGIGMVWGASMFAPVTDYLMPTLVEVRGTVTANGKPVPRGIVMTRCEMDGLLGGLGVIEPDGSFTLTTNGEPGIYSGKHRFIVSCMTATFPPTSLLPDEYANMEKTPFSFVVRRGQANHLDLAIKGDLKEEKPRSSEPRRPREPAPQKETLPD